MLDFFLVLRQKPNDNSFTYFQNIGLALKPGVHTPTPDSFPKVSYFNPREEEIEKKSALKNAEMVEDYNIMGTRLYGRFGSKNGITPKNSDLSKDQDLGYDASLYVDEDDDANESKNEPYDPETASSSDSDETVISVSTSRPSTSHNRRRYYYSRE